MDVVRRKVVVVAVDIVIFGFLKGVLRVDIPLDGMAAMMVMREITDTFLCLCIE